MDLESWLESTDERRGELLAYSRSPLPTDPGERQVDVSKALELGQDAGDLLADLDFFLAQEVARATLAARKDNDANTARIVAKGAVASLQRLRDGVAVMYQTIKDRRFSLMNLNRS